MAGGAPRRVAVAGILELSGVARASGGDILVTDLFTAQRLLGKEGRVDRVDIVLEPGASRAEAAKAIASRLPPGLTLEPPGRAAATADRMVRAFRFNLNALGSLTLLVGGFLIANAVSIAVLRRRPEIATLRAVGAGRSTIFAAFLLEGLAIGVLGTALGEVLGLFASRAALAGGARDGVADLSAHGPHLRSAPTEARSRSRQPSASWRRSLATLVPAWEASRVAPAPALRPGAIEAIVARRLGPRAALAAAAVGGRGAASRVRAVDGFPLFGFAAVGLVVAALALIAPLAVRLGAAVPRLLLGRALGAEGRLAAGFFGGAAARNGTAVAALAMALGMTLAMIVTVASIRETVRVWVASTLSSDLWIKADAGGRSGIVGDLPAGPDPAHPGTRGRGRGRSLSHARDRGRAGPPVHPGLPATFASWRAPGARRSWTGGTRAAVAAQARERGELLVSEPFARRFGADTGSTVTLPTPAGPRRFRVAGVYRDYSNDRGTVVMDRALYLVALRRRADHEPRGPGGARPGRQRAAAAHPVGDAGAGTRSTSPPTASCARRCSRFSIAPSP